MWVGAGVKVTPILFNNEKVLIYQEDLAIVNMYAPSNRAATYAK